MQHIVVHPGSKSIKIGKSDLVDIDCIDQSVEINDTLVPFFYFACFSRFHQFISEDISVHPKMKTNFIQTVNLLTTKLQLRVEGSNNYHFLKKSGKSYFFFKTRFKIFFWFVGIQVFMI